ncbi:MAG: RNA-guided endonuclease TnpB family protein [Methanoculleus sp.]
MLRAYKYRMYPSQEQVASLMHHIHACRFVYNKAIQKLARCHEKVSNQRNDFLHKLSNRVVGENQAIAVESLNVAGMQKNHCLAQSISDVSWSAFFTMLEYKCQMHGKTLLKIGRFEPSSKICNWCGYIKQDLVLAEREWICPDCVLTTTATSTRQSISRSSPCKIKILSGYQAWNAPKGLWTRSRWGGG